MQCSFPAETQLVSTVGRSGWMERALGAYVFDLPINTTCILQTQLFQGQAFSPTSIRNSSGSTWWLENRLGGLQRPSLFSYSYIAQIHLQFQIEFLRAGNVEWALPPTYLARAHRTDRCHGYHRIASNEMVADDEYTALRHTLVLALYPTDRNAQHI